MAEVVQLLPEPADGGASGQPAVIPIYEAKTQLSRLVKRAKAGETIYLGAYGHPEAILAPVPDSRPRFRLGTMAHLHDPDFDSTTLSDPDPEILADFEAGAERDRHADPL